MGRGCVCLVSVADLSGALVLLWSLERKSPAQGVRVIVAMTVSLLSLPVHVTFSCTQSAEDEILTTPLRTNSCMASFTSLGFHQLYLSHKT